MGGVVFVVIVGKCAFHRAELSGNVILVSVPIYIIAEIGYATFAAPQ